MRVRVRRVRDTYRVHAGGARGLVLVSSVRQKEKNAFRHAGMLEC